MLNPYVCFMIISTAVNVLILIYAAAVTDSQRSPFLILSSVCTFLYSFGYLLEITSPTLASAFAGVRVQKMGSPFIVVLNYLFIRDVYEEKRLGPFGYFLIFALPVFNLFAAQAFPFIKLHYTRIEYFWDGMVANCQGELGVVGALAIAYHFVIVSLTIFRIVRHLKGESKKHRNQSLCLLLSILIPLFVNIYHTLSYNRLRIDLNPFAVSVGLMLILYSVRRQNLLNVVPLARTQVIESMADAFIVCGSDFSYLDANRAAKRLFPKLKSFLPGEIINEVNQFKGKNELDLEINGEKRFYQVTKTDILKNNKNSGICIVFHDITDKENQLKAMYDKATIDSMMNIYTRAAFLDIARFRLDDEKAKNRSFALLMIDLDHFKLVNDTYGHPCGDAVLAAVASLVKEHVRKGDIVGRYGGEEITVLLEDIMVSDLLIVVEDLRTIIEKTVISYGESRLKITISIGMAHFPAGTEYSLKDMFLCADSALYKAKNGGRNKACLYEE